MYNPFYCNPFYCWLLQSHIDLLAISTSIPIPTKCRSAEVESSVEFHIYIFCKHFIVCFALNVEWEIETHAYCVCCRCTLQIVVCVCECNSEQTIREH